MERNVSRDCGLEYFEIPKCACSSIKAALLQADGIPVDLNNPSSVHQHKHFCSIPQNWQPRLTFTFVRHPLSRLLSSYREKLQRGLAVRLKGGCPLPVDAPFDQWVGWVTSQPPTDCDKHWMPQWNLILRRERKPDFIGRLEHVQRDWRLLQQFCSLSPLPDLAALNITTQAPFSLSRRAAQQLHAFYACDFQAFGYRHELPGTRQNP